MPTDPDLQALIDGDTWHEFTDSVRQLGGLVWNDTVPATAQERSEGALYLLRFLAAGLRVCVELDDPGHPLIAHNTYNRMSWGLDNPDCNYSYARLDGSTSYRIHGRIGSACNLEFQVTTGHHADGNFTAWQTVSALRGSELVLDDQGQFELTLSPVKPAAGATNWLQVDDQASFLLVREFFADWEGQQPASLQMEKLGAAYPPAPLRAGRIAGHFALLKLWLEAGARCWQDFANGILQNAPAAIQPFIPPAEAAGLGGQAYGMGSFSVAEDEAVILEFAPPQCLVWNISLCDRFFQSIDYEDRQASLNGRQARWQGERCQLVVAHRDPGIHNWLDCGGRNEGIIAVRYVLTETVPPVSYRKVKLTQLDGMLPNVARCSREARSESLRRRRLAYQQRLGS